MLHRLSQQIPLGILFALLAVVPVYAGKNYKISNYGGGHQIWFEAEDYDERNPDTNQYFPVVDQDGAFGQAITRAGGAGGMIRWTFDISAAGGKSGTWYFWARLINPGNTSDYMLVEGDPGDLTIPASSPFPGGDGAAPFDNTDDRVFEETQGPPWAWGRAGHEEGHTKELQNGKNTMYIFHRQGDSTVFWDVFMWTDSASYVPTDDDYRNASVLVPGTASNPTPGVGATDVPHDTALNWTAGTFAGQHDVYFGTDETAVSEATVADAAGVYQGRIDLSTYTVPPLTFGETYYWRIDEVNETPDAYVFKGSVWSFTVEPYGYPVQPVAATASSAQSNMGPENTINGSGMTGDLHGTDGTTMWLSTGEQPNWIQYEFDRVYKLHDLQVWNSNGEVESFMGFGARNVTIEYSTDGATWTALDNVPEFAQAPGMADYAANTTVNFNGVEARFVKLTIDSPWGGLSSVTGLSEVRFSYVPVQARGPQPADNAGGVDLSPTLDWRPGRDATSHQVFFGTDPAAVAESAVPVETVTEHGFVPGTLDFGTFYYWRVDEVGTATYPGSVWSFTTQPYQPVDDFESYTDQEGEEVFSTWIDGVTDGLSNSTVGYFTASGGTFCETAIVHGGKQSMPFEYNNAESPYFSQAERTFDTPQDWTGGGADTLSLWVRGNPAAFVEEDGVITLSAGGHDIWDNADDFRFAYKALNGDGSITAKVESLVNTNDWAKAGVMIRETLEDGSKHAFMAVTPSNSCSAQRRVVTSGASASTDWSGTAVTAPYWVRVTRTGNVFKCESSPDGKTWTALGDDATITMAANVYIGIAVTSHDTSLTTTAKVSNITTTGTVSGPWQAVAIGDDPQTANGPGDLYVVVEDSTGKTATATNPTVVTTPAWTQWTIPLSSLSGVNMSKVEKLAIGVGDKTGGKPGGAGMLYIDDIGFGRPIQWVALPGEILLEAESATSITAPMVIYDDPLASGGKCIGTPTTQTDSSSNPPATGIAQIPFTVPGGTYKLRFRVVIPGDNNSVWVRIADGTTQTANHASGWVRFNEIPSGDAWHWEDVYSSDDGDQVVQWTLAPGAHTLEIAYREAGARVDVIVIQPLN